ncbi:MAG: fibrobacter succinogenes major paralogous domain-containing protein [Candidatus Saccharibacteria bacterium]
MDSYSPEGAIIQRQIQFEDVRQPSLLRKTIAAIGVAATCMSGACTPNPEVTTSTTTTEVAPTTTEVPTSTTEVPIIVCDSTTIMIGAQCWMKENINTGIMINGSINQTNNTEVEKYCYDNNPENCAIYGGLYQWDEMMQYTTTESAKGICPPEFHVPSDEEWKTMELFLGMTPEQADAEGNRGTDQGAQILMTGTSGLDFPVTGYGAGGLFYGINFRTWIWTSSQSNTPLDWAWQRGPQWGQISRDLEQKSDAMPVRCLQD